MAILAVIGLIAILYIAGKLFTKWGMIVGRIGDQMAMHDANSRRYDVPTSHPRDTDVKLDVTGAKSIHKEIDGLEKEMNGLND